jgi:hypothetical protein
VGRRLALQFIAAWLLMEEHDDHHAWHAAVAAATRAGYR